MDVHMHGWMDGFGIITWIYICICMYVCMLVNMQVCAFIQKHTSMHAYSMQFLITCLSNKDYINAHRYERTNMAYKCEIF